MVQWVGWTKVQLVIQDEIVRSFVQLHIWSGESSIQEGEKVETEKAMRVFARVGAVGDRRVLNGTCCARSWTPRCAKGETYTFDALGFASQGHPELLLDHVNSSDLRNYHYFSFSNCRWPVKVNTSGYFAKSRPFCVRAQKWINLAFMHLHRYSFSWMQLWTFWMQLLKCITAIKWNYKTTYFFLLVLCQDKTEKDSKERHKEKDKSTSRSVFFLRFFVPFFLSLYILYGVSSVEGWLQGASRLWALCSFFGQAQGVCSLDTQIDTWTDLQVGYRWL